MAWSLDAATSLLLALRHFGSQPPILLDLAVILLSCENRIDDVVKVVNVAAAFTVAVVIEVLGVSKEGADCVEGSD